MAKKGYRFKLFWNNDQFSGKRTVVCEKIVQVPWFLPKTLPTLAVPSIHILCREQKYKHKLGCKG